MLHALNVEKASALASEALRMAPDDADALRLRALCDLVQGTRGAQGPALQRLLLNGYVDAEWGPSENNRRARYYVLTKAGRKHLAAERAEFTELVSAIYRVLETA